MRCHTRESLVMWRYWFYADAVDAGWQGTGFLNSVLRCLTAFLYSRRISVCLSAVIFPLNCLKRWHINVSTFAQQPATHIALNPCSFPCAEMDALWRYSEFNWSVGLFFCEWICRRRLPSGYNFPGKTPVMVNLSLIHLSVNFTDGVRVGFWPAVSFSLSLQNTQVPRHLRLQTTALNMSLLLAVFR